MTSTTDVPLMREERKLVTVLFADLVGSTSIAERFDPEDAREIVQGALARAIQVIEGFGGTVMYVAGDGVLALFGAPNAHEDDPERAVLAGLGITRQIDDYANNMLHTWSIKGFGIRVGIETGLTVLGPVGAGGRVEYGAVGDVMNTTARLQSHADPGTVLVGEHTRRAVEDLFQWDEQRELTLKGKSEVVAACSVLRARRSQGSVRGPRLLKTPFVGRSAELEMAQAALRDLVVENKGGCLIVTGEPGIGKSRLLAECRESLVTTPDETVRWLEGRCLSYADAVPYGVYRDLILAWLGFAADESPNVTRLALHQALANLCTKGLNEVFPYLSHMLGLPSQAGESELVDGLDAELVQQRTFTAISSLLNQLAKPAPLVIAIEDLHWADPTSLALTQHLLPLTTKAPLLLLLTRRPERDASAELVARLTNDSDGRARALNLAPLNDEAARELLKVLVGTEAIPEAIERELMDSTEGNPFFLEEQIQSMMESDALVREGDRWRFVHGMPVGIAPSVEKAMLARIDQLEPIMRETLLAASVLGREFTLRLLMALSPSPWEVHRAVQGLEGLDLIRVNHAGREAEYRFKHALIQEAGYQSLLKRKRRDLHALAADALETHFKDRVDEIAATLGRHLAEAGQVERAVPYLVTAADRAKNAYANEEAISLYECAVSLIGETANADERRPRWQESLSSICERLGNVLILVGRYYQAREAYEQSLRATSPGDRIRIAYVHVLLAGTDIYRQRYGDALDGCDIAEETLGPVASDPSADWLTSWLEIQDTRISALYWLGETDGMARLIDQVRPFVEGHGSAEQRSTFFGRLTTMALRRDRYIVTDETLELAQAGYAAAQQCDDPEILAWAPFTLGFTKLWRGELDEAVRLLEDSLHQSDRTGDVTLRSQSLTYILVARREQGDVEAVGVLIDRVARAGREASRPEYAGVALANRAWVAWRRGDLAQAESCGREALGIWEALPSRYPLAWMALWPLVGIAIEWSRMSEAVEHARSMLAPHQQVLPTVLQKGLVDTVEAWDAGRTRDAEVRLTQTMEVARRLACL